MYTAARVQRVNELSVFGDVITTSQSSDCNTLATSTSHHVRMTTKMELK